MSELALLFDAEPFTVPALPRPRGLAKLEQGGVVYLLLELAEGHWYEIMGWYFGYPPCCVEHHIAEWDRRRAEHSEAFAGWLAEIGADTDDDERNLAAIRAAERAGRTYSKPERGWGKHHPVSHHLLCPACEAGPLAPLPDRPARRYGYVRWYEEEDRPLFYPPSDYDRRGTT